jgi:hypothetical protein
VVSDIKKLATGFNSCSFIHIGHALNGAAHMLAPTSESESCSKFYFDVKNFVFM